MRTLHKDIVIIGVIFLAIGFMAFLWRVPAQRGSTFENPYELTGTVLIVGGLIIAALGYFDAGRKTT